MDKIPIIVYAYRYMAESGGILALHKLCHMLRKKGENAYIWMADGNISPGATNPAFDTPIANGQVDPKQSVVIYPEIIADEPLSAKVVVRWILYTPGGLPGWPKLIPSPTDIVFYYEPHFYPQGEVMNHLRVFEVQKERFEFTEESVRSGACYLNRKGASKQRIPETTNCIELASTNLDYVIPIFRSKEIFYSYDATTVTSLHAAMCGCLSIVVPDPGLTVEEYRKKLPLFRYGVAYGTSEEEIHYAKRTQHLVKDYLLSIEQEGYRQLEVMLCKLDKVRTIA